MSVQASGVCGLLHPKPVSSGTSKAVFHKQTGNLSGCAAMLSWELSSCPWLSSDTHGGLIFFPLRFIFIIFVYVYVSV